MKRSPIGLDAIADWDTLVAAFHRASRGKPDRQDVRAFAARLDAELTGLRHGILSETVQPGPMTSFRIRDPKPRIIHAPCFRDRVLHHALMAPAGPVLDRALVADTYACRVGKGTLAAVQRCQHHARRFPWYGQIDIQGYFATIDHDRLLALLARRFKDPGLLRLFGRIVRAHAVTPGKGLPIGALTSQHLANAYLGGLDRYLLETCRVRGLVRYMDDVVWWSDSRAEASAVLAAVRAFVAADLRLTVKDTARIGRSADGVGFCGYRVRPGALLLSRRRRRRYAQRRLAWERAYAEGAIEAGALQAGYGAVLAITAHADAAGWRRRQLRQRPVAGAACAL